MCVKQTPGISPWREKPPPNLQAAPRRRFSFGNLHQCQTLCKQTVFASVFFSKNGVPGCGEPAFVFWYSFNTIWWSCSKFHPRPWPDKQSLSILPRSNPLLIIMRSRVCKDTETMKLLFVWPSFQWGCPKHKSHLQLLRFATHLGDLF